MPTTHSQKIETTSETTVESVSTHPPKVTAPTPRFPMPRRFERVPIHGKIAIESLGTYDVTDISLGGLFVPVPYILQVGTSIKFSLSSDAFPKVLEMTGVAIRQGVSFQKHGTAIEFTRVNPAHKRMIADYIQSVLMKAS